MTATPTTLGRNITDATSGLTWNIKKKVMPITTTYPTRIGGTVSGNTTALTSSRKRLIVSPAPGPPLRGRPSATALNRFD